MKKATTGVEPLELVRAAARAIKDKKGLDVVILEVGPLIVITDYFVIGAGTNPRQIDTIAAEVIKRVEGTGGSVYATHGLESAHWVLIDCGSVVVHVFDPDTRDLYDLEHLWADAARVEIEAPEDHRARRDG